MKKTIIKLLVFAAVFVLSVILIGRGMNEGHDNLTMEMAAATFPLVTMELDGIAYNQLHGFRSPMETALQRDTVTVLGESRDTGFSVETFGRDVTGVSVEVRSADGSRLVENTRLTDYQVQDDRIRGNIALKDLIEKDTEYSLAILLELNGGETVYYYTKAVWSDALYAKEKLAYALDFHSRLYNRDAARELTKYLETDSQLEDNASFHNVNIHSSFRQITWGDMQVKEAGEPVLRLTEIAGETASLLMDYVVTTSDAEGRLTYYTVKEHFRVRYTPERMYLLDYERTMTQIPDTEEMYANDKILLGITGADVPMMESEDGNTVVFEAAGKLFSYNATANKLTVIFSFYDAQNADWRTLYDQHAVKILDVDESGSVQFALYGYMNRGRHEGEVGIQLYSYNSSFNTIEELLYIPCHKPYAVLAAEMERLLYLNRAQKLYLELDNVVYEIDMERKVCSPLLEVTQDGGMQVSENHKILVWSQGKDMFHSQELYIRNLSTETQNSLKAGNGEAIRPLGFMEEDIIFGVARQEDIRKESSGRIFFPMYKICISSPSGELLKEYEQENLYVTHVQVEGNQITLYRLTRGEDGASYQQALTDQIVNNRETAGGKNQVVTADIQVYQRYVQIQTQRTIDPKTIMILNPKEVVFEGGRELSLPERQPRRYYVYGPYGVSGIYTAPAAAVERAYDISGVVADESGSLVWMRGNRAARSQITALREIEKAKEQSSLAACLDAVFAYEGLVRNSAYLLSRGKSATEILEENLEDARVLDLTGCSLDAILYYINRNIPALALLQDGEAVLVTGFDEFNVILSDPGEGKSYRKGRMDSAEWFEENGNCFITYVRRP